MKVEPDSARISYRRIDEVEFYTAVNRRFTDGRSPRLRAMSPEIAAWRVRLWTRLHDTTTLTQAQLGRESDVPRKKARF